MPVYRLELIRADGQIAQTLAFFSFDDVQALAWGFGAMESALHGSYPAAKVWEDNRLVGKFSIPISVRDANDLGAVAGQLDG